MPSIAELQEIIRARTAEWHDDDPVKLSSVELWIDAAARARRNAEDTLFRLAIDHGRNGFGEDDPDVAELKEKLADHLADIVGCTFIAACAAGIDMEETLLRKFDLDGKQLGGDGEYGRQTAEGLIGRIERVVGDLEKIAGRVLPSDQKAVMRLLEDNAEDRR